VRVKMDREQTGSSGEAGTRTLRSLYLTLYFLPNRSDDQKDHKGQTPDLFHIDNSLSQKDKMHWVSESRAILFPTRVGWVRAEEAPALAWAFKEEGAAAEGGGIEGESIAGDLRYLGA
jgi:hypothetical protein